VKRPSIAVLSDQTLFRESLAELLRNRGFRELRESASIREASRAPHPKLLVIDLDHQREDAMTLLRALRHQLPETQLVVIGSALRQAAANGIYGLEIETPSAGLDTLLAALRSSRVRSSAELVRLRKLWSRLTARQRDVLRWLATGADNQTIAKKLRVGERAVKMHVTALLELFSLQNRTQLALVASNGGLAPPRARG
jgi:DNA-binding NarL/FixJ family response regulator